MEDLPDELELRDLLHGAYEYPEFSSEELRELRPPDFAYNILNQYERLYTPVVDHERINSEGRRPDWPGDAEFGVCLTHDVDNVSKHDPKQTLRRRLLHARLKLQSNSPNPYLNGTGVVAAAKSLAGALLYSGRVALESGRDPYHQYERWLEIEDEYGATSTFFVLPERTRTSHASDPKYRYDDRVVFDGDRCSVAEMVSSIDDQGWEIGLHPSWYAYDDATELRRQKAALEAVTDSDVVSVRQHYLHFDPRKTPRAHDEAGFRFDATLGFNKNVGFRRGSSYPWRAVDLERHAVLELIEIPMAVQDVALFRDRGLALDPEKAIEYVRMLAAEVKRTGGVLTLSWHARAVADERSLRVYKEVLQALDEMGAWFGSVAEIGDVWQSNGIGLSP